MADILFQTSEVNGMKLKNRLFMEAMHLGYAENGYLSERDFEFYRMRAKGGVGSIVTVARVNDMGGPGDMASAEDDKYMPGMQKLSDILHEYSCNLIVQLFHCGRNGPPAILGKNHDQDPIAPSPVPSPIYRTVPREMTKEEILSTVNDFGSAARRCKENGADAVEISCSAGYLLPQFLSPITNLRTDEFGGSEENRMRFPRLVVQKVREIVGPDYPVILRISGGDMLPGGYGIDFMQRFCSGLEPGWVDMISVTGGWHEAPVPQITINLPEGGYAYLAGAIKRVVDVPVIASNRIHSRKVAEEILEKGMADYVAAARAYLADAEFANKIRNNESYNPCQACNRGCIERVLRGQSVQCAFNPATGLENLEIGLSKVTKDGKRVLVIGGGPAGMEAAKRAAQKGHKVILCTDETQLGGQIQVAQLPPEKARLQGFVDYLAEELKDLNIEIRYQTIVDAALIDEIRPDEVVVATGSEAIVPRIDGIEQDHVIFAEDVLLGERDTLTRLYRGKTVIIGGGSVGLETAHHLALNSVFNENMMHFINQYVPFNMRNQFLAPLDITVIEMDKKVGKTLGGTKWILMNQLKQLGVKIATSTKVLSIGHNFIEAETPEGKKEFPADNVVLAIGYKARGKELIEHLKKEGYSFTVIGDAKQPADLMCALSDAYQDVG